MSGEDIIHHVRSNHYGDTLKEFQGSGDAAEYSECSKRKIKTKDGKEITIKYFLIEEGTLVQNCRRNYWKNMTNEHFIDYVRSQHYGDTISEIQKQVC